MAKDKSKTIQPEDNEARRIRLSLFDFKIRNDGSETRFEGNQFVDENGVAHASQQEADIANQAIEQEEENERIYFNAAAELLDEVIEDIYEPDYVEPYRPPPRAEYEDIPFVDELAADQIGDDPESNQGVTDPDLDAFDMDVPATAAEKENSDIADMDAPPTPAEPTDADLDAYDMDAPPSASEKEPDVADMDAPHAAFASASEPLIDTTVTPTAAFNEAASKPDVIKPSAEMANNLDRGEPANDETFEVAPEELPPTKMVVNAPAGPAP